MPLRKDVPDETWGELMARLRRRARLSQTVIAEIVDGFQAPTTRATISNLEQLDAPPQNRADTIRAIVAGIAYGYHPSALDLDDSVLPKGMSVRSIQINL